MTLTTNAGWKVGQVVGTVDTRTRGEVGANPTWHLAQTESGREQLAYDRLTDAGYEVYFPMMRVMKSVPRKLLSRKQRLAGASVKRPQMSALFPGYVIVRFDQEAGGWHEIFDFAHVRGLVMSGGLIKQIADKEIRDLQMREVDGAVPGETPLAVLPFEIGERVRIASGPFREFTGIIERLPTAKLEELDESVRIHLLVHLFGAATPVELGVGDIEKM